MTRTNEDLIKEIEALKEQLEESKPNLSYFEGTGYYTKEEREKERKRLQTPLTPHQIAQFKKHLGIK